MKHLIFILGLLNFSILTTAQSLTEVKSVFCSPINICNLSNSLNIPKNISAKECTWKTLTCEQIESKGDFIGVHIKFKCKTDIIFSLKSNFKNIKLINKVTEKILHPYAILWNDSEFNSTTDTEIPFIGYMTNNFKAEEYNVSCLQNEQYDLILLFEKAELGNKLVIENFIETEISE